MAKRVLLHLGAHKTGTSVIQRFMRDKPDLMSRNGFAFTLRSETDKLIGWSNPQHLARQRQHLIDRINAGFENDERYFVLSHENAIGRPLVDGVAGLYPRCRKASRLLADGLSDFDVKVLFYIRDQASYLESYYLQTIHQGKYHRFHDWISRIDFKSVSWAPVVRSIREAFHDCEFEVKDFAAEMSVGQEQFLASAFRSICPGLNPADFDDFEYEFRRNTSIGDKGLEISLRINELIETLEERKKIRKFVQRHFSNLEYPRPQLLSDADKQQFRSLYEEENSSLLGLIG